MHHHLRRRKEELQTLGHRVPTPWSEHCIAPELIFSLALTGIGKRDVAETVAEYSLKPAIRPEEKPLPTIDKYTQETTKMMFNLMKRLDHLVDHIDNVLSFSVHNEFCLHVTDLIERLKYTDKELKNVQEEKKKTVTGK